jgi:hypothetical protein
MSREEQIAEWSKPVAPPTPERIAEMTRELEEAEQARRDARWPAALKPGTKVKVHITGWQYDPTPAEVVSDNICGLAPRTITAKRLRREGEEECVTVRFENVSLWRGA